MHKYLGRYMLRCEPIVAPDTCLGRSEWQIVRGQELVLRGDAVRPSLRCQERPNQHLGVLGSPARLAKDVG